MNIRFQFQLRNLYQLISLKYFIIRRYSKYEFNIICRGVPKNEPNALHSITCAVSPYQFVGNVIVQTSNGRPHRDYIIAYQFYVLIYFWKSIITK